MWGVDLLHALYISGGAMNEICLNTPPQDQLRIHDVKLGPKRRKLGRDQWLSEDVNSLITIKNKLD